MTNEATLYKFFSQFGIPAYPNTAVPDKAVFPYLTYELQTAYFGDGDQYITIQLWYKTDSESLPNAKANEIAAVIGRGGVMLESGIWVKRGSPWCVAANTENDKTIKLRQLNVTLEYLN